ncbi:hypothetical protein [Occultella aeris]|uniref:hypothetical protein n=1 Tax=Occultella aeris TaxID=2761496 RepID=UPI0012E9C51B|nr:hypothetical protein [Occultella aeris]
MAGILDDLSSLTGANDTEFAFICAEVLAVLNVEEPGGETLDFDLVSVTVDRNQGKVTFESVIDDETVSMSAERFAEAAAPLAEVRSAEQVAEWHRNRRERHVWLMPPAASG